MFCAHCGNQLQDGQRFCKTCGTASGAGMSGGPPPLPPLRPAQDSMYGSGASIPYAGFWIRVAAWAIDYVILVFALAVLGAVFGRSIGDGLLGLLTIILLVFYTIVMECSSLQATLGKLICGIKVTDLNGERIGFGRSVGRYFAHLLDSLTLGIGLVMPVLTQRKQALHDLVAGTLVVRRMADPREIAEAGPAPRVNGAVMALAIIGVVLFGPFGVGILAAIAIPAYQSYTVRAQIASGLMDADAYKGLVSQALARGARFEDINSNTLSTTPETHSPYVDSIKVVSGVVLVTYGGKANAKLRGQSLALVPATAEEKIVWVCGRAAVPQGLSPAVGDPGQYTTVSAQYLPVACRS